MTKTEMRRVILGVLSRIDPGDAPARSSAVSRRLAETAEWEAADCVLAFLSLPRELDTRPIIFAARAAGKPVAVPRIQGDDLVFHYMGSESAPLHKGLLGIREPDPSWPAFDPQAITGESILVVTPGLAFDRRGCRLGRGKGFYDRFLRGLREAAPGRVTAMAVCFSEQLVPEVPQGPEDELVNAVVTDAETVWAAVDVSRTIL